MKTSTGTALAFLALVFAPTVPCEAQPPRPDQRAYVMAVNNIDIEYVRSDGTHIGLGAPELKPLIFPARKVCRDEAIRALTTHHAKTLREAAEQMTVCLQTKLRRASITVNLSAQ